MRALMPALLALAIFGSIFGAVAVSEHSKHKYHVE